MTGQQSNCKTSAAAIFFIVGTGLFLICTLIDLKSSIGSGCVAVMNSLLYVIGAAALEAGSIAFYPGIVDDVICNGGMCPIGQYLYIAATLVICFALLWVSYLHGTNQHTNPLSSQDLKYQPLTHQFIDHVNQFFKGYCSSNAQWQRDSLSIHHCLILSLGRRNQL